MPRTSTPLTNIKIKNAKPKEKKYKLTDGRGLFIIISPRGSKLWRLKYRYQGKEKEYAIGTYPVISLQEAREERERLKKLLTHGIDPNEEKKQKVATSTGEVHKKENTFYNVSQKWHAHYRNQVTEAYHNKLGKALENYTYKEYITSQNTTLCIKDKPIDEIRQRDIATILEALCERGIRETARRTSSILNRVFKYAVTHELTPHNIIADIDLGTVLGKKSNRHYPTFTKNKDIRALLINIDNYQGHYTTNMILKILPYLFVRSGNIRKMEWQEIDFSKKVWVIPAKKMKVKKEFILPLPSQVITLLKDMKKNMLHHIYVFPSPIKRDQPISDNSLISALRRMDYSTDEFVPHSFRSMFATIAYEKANDKNGHSYTGEVIEALLAHKEKNKIKEAYNRSNYTDAMSGLIQWYADYLDNIKKE